MELTEIALSVGLGLAFVLGFGIPEFRKGFWEMQEKLGDLLKNWQTRVRAKKPRQLTLTFFC